MASGHAGRFRGIRQRGWLRPGGAIIEATAGNTGVGLALVSLTAETATAYVQVRTFQRRLAYARRNVEIQKGSLGIVEARVKDGRATGLDLQQARANLAQTEATIPPLEIGLRRQNDRLCVLLGLPPQALASCLHEAPIPTAPPEVAVGVPVDLLIRRPDVRAAEREAAAQSAGSAWPRPTSTRASA